MHFAPRATPCALALAAAALASPAVWATPAAPAAQSAASPQATLPAPKAHVTVIEDDAVRIEETRGRDGVRRVRVQSKGSSLRPYEIQVAPAGRDPSQEKGSAGKRTWSLLDW